MDFDGTVALGPEAEVVVGLAGGYRLSTPAPNPFGQQSRFTLMLARTQQVRVEVVDLQGRRMAVLHDGPLASGAANAFALNAQGLATGFYTIRVVGETFSAARQVALVR